MIQPFIYSATIYWEATVCQALCYTVVYGANRGADVKVYNPANTVITSVFHTLYERSYLPLQLKFITLLHFYHMALTTQICTEVPEKPLSYILAIVHDIPLDWNPFPLIISQIPLQESTQVSPLSTVLCPFPRPFRCHSCLSSSNAGYIPQL